MLDGNDELQNDDNQFLDTEYEEVDDVEPQDELEDESADSDSDPDSETGHEAKGGDEQLNDFSKEKVNERFGKLTRERAEAERRAKAAEERLQQLEEERLQASKPYVPELPDPDEVSDSEFMQAVQQREKAIQAQAQWQQQYNQHEQYKQQSVQQQAYTRQQEMQKVANAYAERAKSFGIKEQELQQAGQVINQVGLNDDVAMHILSDEKGALITRHLGNNIQDLLEVASMNPVQAAVYIERNIKPKLATPKRRSNAARPPQRVKGGAPRKSDKYPLTGGKARFE
jgi:hypothetical protein